MVPMARDVMCMHHAMEGQLNTVRATAAVLEQAAKELPAHLVPVMQWIRDATKLVVSMFLETPCTCWEGPDTEIIGGRSWVSDGADVANLPDLLDVV